jgi:spore coat protein CotF
MQLTQKEMSLLKDLKEQEKLCVEKYTRYSSQAVDPQLKDLFNSIAGIEQEHLNTLTQIEQGQMPSTSSGGGSSVTTTFSQTYNMSDTPEKQADCFLCSDLLADEKHVSSLYNTCIFEFKQQNLRDTLNHIQKEEQEHGKSIYYYMSTNNMYS